MLTKLYKFSCSEAINNPMPSGVLNIFINRKECTKYYVLSTDKIIKFKMSFKHGRYLNYKISLIHLFLYIHIYTQ